MHTRSPSRNILIAALVCGFVFLGGCATSRTRVSDTTSTPPPSTGEIKERLEFGPIYSTQQPDDPIVKKAIESIEVTGTIVNAEIRGFLLDWPIRETSTSEHILEYAVMKDGSMHHLAGMNRPSASFGWLPPARLEPEPSEEANARVATMAAAQAYVEKQHPDFAVVEPAIYGYLVRIHRKETSHVDIWVVPDGSVLFYKSLRRLPNKGIAGDPIN